MGKNVKYFISVIVIVFLSGCAGGAGFVKKDLVLQTKRIGVLSVVMTRVGGDTGNNVKARAAILKNAQKIYEDALNEMPNWTVAKSSTIKGHPVLKAMGNIPENPETQPFLMELANKEQLPLDNEAVFAQAVMASLSMDAMKLDSVKKKAVAESAKEIQKKIIEYYQKKYQGVKSLPLIPYRLASGKGGGKHHIAAAQAIIRKNIVTLCKAKNLDAVLVVQLNSDVETTGGFHLTMKGRTKGIIKVNPEIALISSNGEAVILMGSSNLDDLAPMDVGPPVYVGKPGTSSFKIDLNDPKGEVVKAYSELIRETCQKLIGKITKEING